VDLVLRKLSRPAPPCRTATTLLPEAGLQDRDAPDPIAHAVHEEMAHTLSDVVIRRTGMGAAGKPADGVMQDAAARMQTLLAWSEERKATELEALRRFYDVG
jgi:glycerol-3-phosphate dehydrogenase